MATVISIEDLRRSPTAALFEGRDEAPVSIFVTQYQRGQGPALHLHPYPEGDQPGADAGRDLVDDARHKAIEPNTVELALLGFFPDSNFHFHT